VFSSFLKIGEEINVILTYGGVDYIMEMSRAQMRSVVLFVG
jgi:hypothetical protein